ncbi:hypothetical protein HY632_04710 [Candidatus Uhrbacteria bacterium]|nr:hypothetical protein [Candidatus Uhrbacteria bacterium]
MQTYFTIDDMLEMIPEPNRSACQRLLAHLRAHHPDAPGSTHNHQAWPGGYLDHLCEFMNLVIVFYRSLSQLRSQSYTLADALLVGFLHDLEKPWALVKTAQGTVMRIAVLQPKDAQHEFRMAKIQEFGIVLTPDQEDALRYVEGEMGVYSEHRRHMSPLACCCHLADCTSARMWPEHPLASDDPWRGAARWRGADTAATPAHE